MTWMAIDLMHMPSRVKTMRSAPLPKEVVTLLHIAAGDEEAMREAVQVTGRSGETIREAAAFFIEQMQLYPDADSYRVLGARPEASNTELRRNMALLLRWLHPDRQSRSERSVFAGRVTRAWNDLKTEERRAVYDRSRRIAANTNKSSLRKNRNGSKAHPPQRNDRAYRSPAGSRQSFHHYPRHVGFLRRVLLLLLGERLL